MVAWAVAAPPKARSGAVAGAVACAVGGGGGGAVVGGGGGGGGSSPGVGPDRPPLKRLRRHRDASASARVTLPFAAAGGGAAADVVGGLDAGAASKMLAALREVAFPKQVRRKVVAAGSRAEEEEATGPRSMPLGLVLSWRLGVGVSRFTGVQEELTRLLCVSVRSAQPNFPFTSLQVNKNHMFALHVDNRNVGPSLILGLGDYLGGQLYVHGRGRLDVQRRWLEFDGNVPHLTCGFSGERFSVVAFVHECFRKVSPADEARLRGLGFCWPARAPEADGRARRRRGGAAATSALLREAALALPPELQGQVCQQTLDPPRPQVSTARRERFDKRFEEHVAELEQWVRSRDGALPTYALAVRTAGGAEARLGEFLNRTQKAATSGALAGDRRERFARLPELRDRLLQWEQLAAAHGAARRGTKRRHKGAAPTQGFSWF